MRISKTIVIGTILTIFATGYVHQHVEIVKTGYNLQKNRKYLAHLVDQNSKLMYSLSKLESPKYLLASLENEDIEFASHRAYQLNSYQLAQLDTSEAFYDDSLVGKILDLFTLNAEARSH